MPGPTGLLPFEARFPDRFIDVGIAEQHAVTAAAGMAMAGMRPVVAVYSTFFSRAFDQANLDVGLHGCRWSSSSTGPASPATTAPATTGCSTWPSALSIPGMTVFAPSCAAEVEAMLDDGAHPRRARRSSASRRRRPGRSAATPSAPGLEARLVRAR